MPRLYFLGRVTEGYFAEQGTHEKAAQAAPAASPSPHVTATFSFFVCTKDHFITRSFCPLNWQMFTYLSLGIQMKGRG